MAGHGWEETGLQETEVGCGPGAGLVPKHKVLLLLRGFLKQWTDIQLERFEAGKDLGITRERHGVLRSGAGAVHSGTRRLRNL